MSALTSIKNDLTLGSAAALTTRILICGNFYFSVQRTIIFNALDIAISAFAFKKFKTDFWVHKSLSSLAATAITIAFCGPMPFGMGFTVSVCAFAIGFLVDEMTNNQKQRYIY